MPTPSATIHSLPITPQTRARLTMRGVEDALARQAEALAEFRAALAALRQSLHGLSGSAQGFQRVVGRTATEIARAQDSAERLKATATGMERVVAAPPRA